MQQPAWDPIIAAAAVAIALAAALWALRASRRRVEAAREAPRDRGRRDGGAEALLAAIVASSDDAIVSKDLDGVIRSWNGAAERLFGYTAEEAVGRPIELIIPPERRGEERIILERLHRGERVEHFETVRRRKDGGLVDVALAVSPVRDRGGRVVGASKVARDVTARKAAEEQLRLRALLLEQAFDPILVWALDGAITYWNGAASGLYGFTAGEAVGRVSHDLLGTQVPGGPGAILASLRAAGRWEGELRHRTKAGRWVNVDSRMTVLERPGRGSWVMETNRDVTERARLVEDLRSSRSRAEALSLRVLRAQEDERRRIARELHDGVGQALTALKIDIQQAIAGVEAGPRLAECLSIIDETLADVRGMALSLRPSILDDLGLVAALDWYVSRHAERTGLDGRLDADPGDVRCDPEIATVCFRVAQEALTNVARHARATRFVVELRGGGDGVRLVVRDDGVGFDPVEAARAAGRGAGFGLLGMRERVELVGGRIALDSAPGRGTEVRVDLPAEPHAPRSAVETPDPGGA